MFLSVIIPVYNAADTISRCLESIWSQNLPPDEYEVICVDDCSPDNSVEVLQNIQQKHSNLRIERHTENLRAGGARNTGVCAAQGEYILFIDADDYFHPGSLGSARKFLQQTPVDILVCEYIRELEGSCGTKVLHHYSDDKIYSPEEYRLHHGFLPYGPWQWFFRKSIMVENQVWFVEKVCAEDVDWTHKLAHFAQTMRCVPVILMHYVLTTTSQTAQAAHSGKTAYHALMASTRLCEVAELWKNPENRNYIYLVAGTYATAGIKSYLFFHDSLKQKIQNIQKYTNRKQRIGTPWIWACRFPRLYALFTNVIYPFAVWAFKIRSKYNYRGVKK